MSGDRGSQLGAVDLSAAWTGQCVGLARYSVVRCTTCHGDRPSAEADSGSSDNREVHGDKNFRLTVVQVSLHFGSRYESAAQHASLSTGALCALCAKTGLQHLLPRET